MGLKARFIDLAGEINYKMVEYIYEKILSSLKANGKIIKNSKILILGLSYKKNIDDLRESPSLKLIKILMDKNFTVSYSDPYFKSIPKQGLQF